MLHRIFSAFVVFTLMTVVCLFGNEVSGALAAGYPDIVSVASDGSPGNFQSELPTISADGRYVAFQSAASTLVPGDTNTMRDVFVHDRQTGITERISVASDGSQANIPASYSGFSPSISADGRYVVFSSNSTNLVSSDSNGQVEDIFIHDRQTGITELVSMASDGTQGNSYSAVPFISADGRYISFQSNATNLVSGDTNGQGDIFVHDRQAGTTERVSVASDGAQSNNGVGYSPISADGRYIAFSSFSSNLVPGDTNNKDDIFVHDRQTGNTERISVSSNGEQGNNYSGGPSISADGRYIAFSSIATNLLPDDTNNLPDFFVHDRQSVL